MISVERLLVYNIYSKLDINYILKQLIREELNSQKGKWQIKFSGDEGEDIPYSEIFPTEEAAVKFMRGQEWDEHVEFWGDNGPEYKIVFHYHNPEDGENYNDYSVEKI